LIGLGVYALFAPVKQSEPAKTVAPVRAKSQPFAELARQYKLLHPEPANWWLESGDEAGQERNMVRTAVALKEHGDVISVVLAKYRDTSELTRALDAAFPTRWITFQRGGISQSVFQDDGTASMGLPSLEICFVPRAERGGQPSGLWYKREWNAVMVSAIDWPEKVFPAVLLHEMGHALFAKEKRPSSVAASDTDEFISEEITMHGLEDQVLARANGSYRIYQQIVTLRLWTRLLDHVGPVSWRDLLEKLAIDDLAELDKALGCTGCVREVAGVLFAQYLISLGVATIDSRTPEPDRQREKIALYRWLTHNGGG